MKRLILLLLIAASCCHVQAQIEPMTSGHWSGCIINPDHPYTLECVSRWITDEEEQAESEKPMLPTCGKGRKLQRYHVGNMWYPSQTEDWGGWTDVDTSKPHDGDYRCVKVKPPTN